ncbi:MAG: ATP-dependent DNA helicase [Lachnospiraceae bacterium]|nr:ATP-dependent DNA helicase [Lachnospiraceae bacterium]
MDAEKTQEQLNKLEIRISVRALVEFLLRAGDIDNRRVGAPENAMQEGGRIHRMIQKRMGEGYEDEVFLRYQHETEHYILTIEGRADGVYTEKNDDIRFIPESEDAGLELVSEEKRVTIDEIKGTYRNLDKITKPVPEHLAQAKMYAYIYASQHDLKTIRVRMTYCNIETEEIKFFYEEFTIYEITDWFQSVMKEYQKWADYESEWRRLRQESIQQMTFPFEYREGQKQLVGYVYQTIVNQKKLFVEAPTGVGKTISTVYPSIKAMAEGMGDKLFYLTAKTITRTVAENTFALLRERGLQFKSVILTAKDKICFMEETECNPEKCPYAKGHYDRINDAIFDLLTHEDSFTRDNIEEYARKHQVCPFEFCLDMSLYADGIVCDYNYVFDPHVYLKRFFGDGNSGKYLFLVDEGHNLLERGREMYSAVLRKEDFLELKKKIHVVLSTTAAGRIHEYGGKLEKQLDKCNRDMLVLKKDCENFQIVEFIDPFVQSLNRLYDTINQYLEEHDDNAVRKDILDFFFEIAHFLEIYELVDDKYVMYTEYEEDGSFILKLFCVDPSTNLRECMNRARSSVLFSATFLPIQYYKKLLGGKEEDYEVYAKSVFDPEKRALLIGGDVTSKYTRRNEDEYFNIAKYIEQIVKNRHGNYMVFFPSYAFMQEVYASYQEYFANDDTECLVQDSFMNEEQREAFLARFEGNPELDLTSVMGIDVEIDSEGESERTLIGFCVMGGIFGEGIDLKHDSLIGVIVVGTGLPQVCNERELLKAYFDADGESGFDYAYRYPGMNKVLQAAGRVIRTSDDVGIIALLDERFLQGSYQRMFPREWMNFEVVNLQSVSKRVERFWDSWL